jgi:hypothetical protein
MPRNPERGMPFSNSTFTVDINGAPIFVFQAKRHGDAEEVCSEWTETYLADLVAKDLVVYDANSSIKVRLARSDELTAYQTATDATSSSDDVKLVYLVNLSP